MYVAIGCKNREETMDSNEKLLLAGFRLADEVERMVLLNIVRDLICRAMYRRITVKLNAQANQHRSSDVSRVGNIIYVRNFGV